MTKAKEKAERKAKAIALVITPEAGFALLTNNEQEFLRLFSACDVRLKFTCVLDGEDIKCDLFSAACYGTISRKKDDLVKLVVERMIAERVDLPAHRTDIHDFTALMMAAMYCGREVVGILLEFCDPAATTFGGFTAAELATTLGHSENAGLINAFILGKDEAKIFGDDIPIPPARPRKSIDTR